MKKKKLRVLRAKEIRKATGLSLPVAMLLARKGLEARWTEDGAGKTALAAQAAIGVEPFCECCGPCEYMAIGPKGSIPISYV